MNEFDGRVILLCESVRSKPVILARQGRFLSESPGPGNLLGREPLCGNFS
jgi:hypothetical protein